MDETPSDPSWVVGVDIGGTFTDLVAIDLQTGAWATAKALTTPSDPTQGIIDVIEVARAESNLELEAVSDFVHATTLVINIVIERKGARVGLVTTAGFTDALEMAHGNRYDLFDLQIRFQRPLVDRHCRLGLLERVDAEGQVIVPLDGDSARVTVASLAENGIESVAVCLLHAYKNAVHEQKFAGTLREHIDVPVSTSSDVAPIIREYERSLATVVNAYVAPKLATYLSRLSAALRERGFAGVPQIMRSDGGWFSAEQASRYPVRILESGPAAGAIAAATTAVRCDAPRALAFDMGGTTAKACLVLDGEPAATDELEISRLARFKRGSGLPIRLPSVDLLEIGAGGGSIASLGPLGLLQVGPQSSGAEPGPASYGRGGQWPTITDADLVLCYLNPDYFADGAMTLDVAAARAAIEDKLVSTDAFDTVTSAAWSVHDLVNENMALAMRLHCVEHGVHPSSVAIVATGGAGPLHATGVLAKLGAQRVICPPHVGVASAIGLLQAPWMTERTVSDLVLLEDLTPAEIENRFERITRHLIDGQSTTDALTINRFMNLRLRGQGYDLQVAIPPVVMTLSEVADAFDREYRDRFGRAPSAAAQCEIVDWTVRATESRAMATEKLDRHPPSSVDAPDLEPPGRRPAYWGPEHGWCDASIYRRSRLSPLEQTVYGPALIEEATSTLVVRPDQMATVDEHLNLIVERK